MSAEWDERLRRSNVSADALKQWRPLAYKLAYSYWRRHRDVATMDDCHALAMEGVWEALATFDPAYGAVTFTWVYKLAKHRLDTHLRAYWARGVRQTMRRAFSLDSPAEDADGNPGLVREMLDEQPLADEALEVVEARSQVLEVLECLSARELQVVRMRYYEGVTHEEAGARLGVSRQRVEQIQRKALGKLRRALVGKAEAA